MRRAPVNQDWGSLLGICMNTQMDYFTVTVFVPDHLLNTLLRRDIGV